MPCKSTLDPEHCQVSIQTSLRAARESCAELVGYTLTPLGLLGLEAAELMYQQPHVGMPSFSFGPHRSMCFLMVLEPLLLGLAGGELHLSALLHGVLNKLQGTTLDSSCMRMQLAACRVQHLISLPDAANCLASLCDADGNCLGS